MTTRAEIVDLAAVRYRRRVTDSLRRVNEVIDNNRLAFSRLYHCGLLFTRLGSKAGRGLLKAHDNLTRVASLLEEVAQSSPRDVAIVASIFDELDELLSRTNQLTAQTGRYLSRMRRS